MILVDANLLIYAYDVPSAHHEKAKQWLAACFRDEPRVGLSWSGIQAFLRIFTNKGYRGHISVQEASLAIGDWLERENTVVLHPGPRHWEIFAEAIHEGQASGSLITDAHLAALAIEHGATLYTHDRDFARFPKLKLADPLR